MVLQRQEQRQVQSLALTPQLREAIKLLELPSLEVSAYVEQAILDNPLLSIEEASLEEVPERDKNVLDPFEDLAAPEYDNLWTHTSENIGFSQRENRFEEPANLFDQISNQPTTLRDHLISQFNSKIGLDDIDKHIGWQLIDRLDEVGYLRSPLITIAEELGCTLKQVEKIFYQLQQLEPVGVFARDLAECFRLQLQDLHLLTPPIDFILRHLVLLGEGKIEKVCRLTHITSDELSRIVKIFRTLNPRPGMQYDSRAPATLIPDVYVLYDVSSNEWRVTLNESYSQRLTIEKGHGSHFKKNEEGKAFRKYLQTHLGHAQWLIKSLEQRRATILAVSKEIVRVQDAFFYKGISFLKPLVLKDIAETLGMHESTISRVTSHKYMSTPRGLFELKYFFSQGLSSSHKEEIVATQSIKHRLKELIDSENKQDPYSDETLVALFAQEGIDVARRTVAKYREAQDIPTSYKRRASRLHSLG